MNRPLRLHRPETMDMQGRDYRIGALATLILLALCLPAACIGPNYKPMTYDGPMCPVLGSHIPRPCPFEQSGVFLPGDRQDHPRQPNREPKGTLGRNKP